MMTVLVVGDANVDLVLHGDVVPRFGQEEQMLDTAALVLGGSAAIVASGLARLGVPTYLAAVTGDDAYGAVVRTALVSAGVQTRFVETSERAPTGISVILSAESDRAILTLAGAMPLLTADAILHAVEESGAEWVHFASPFLLPALTAQLPEVIRRLRAAGIGTSLDTNWDPSQRWMAVAELVPLVDVLLPNLTELAALAAALTPGTGDAAAGLSALGPHVVVKAGADGGWSFDRNGVVTRADGIPVDVVDTTGAGDSFDAGYLAAIAHGYTEEADRLRWATIAGSLSTRAAGGTGAQASFDELRSLLAPV
jgi:sugar/nucleoside kinase (ribokinase family)